MRLFAPTLLISAAIFGASGSGQQKSIHRTLPTDHLGTVPVGVEAGIRMRDSRVYTQVRVTAIDDHFLHLVIREDSFTLAYGLHHQERTEKLPRSRVFRVYAAGLFYTDLPMTSEDHIAFDHYVDFALERGDYILIHDGTRNIGFFHSESEREIALSMTDGLHSFSRDAIRGCRIKGITCPATEGAGVAVVASAKGARNFTEALEATLPVDAKGKSFGVSAFQNMSGNKTADAMAASLKSKAVAHLTALGYRVADRETLPSVLKEKQLSQQGVLAGSDKALDQTAQNDFIISGNLESGGSDNYQVVINVVSTRSLAVVSSKIAQVEATEGASNPDAYRHNGFHASFLLGPGFSTYNVSGVQGFDTLSLSGTGLMVQFRGGFAIEESLILGLSIGSSFSREPSISATPDTLTEKRLTGRTLGLSTWGPSLTYYSQKNYFASLMVGAATAIYTDKQQEISVNNGFATSLALGREWWQSENFAMGISFNIIYSYIALTDLELLLKTTNGDVKDTNFAMSQLSFFLAFSVSYR